MLKARSIRPFIGSADFNVSRSFYRELGFEETVLSPRMSVFKYGDFAFYLQDAYVKDWIENTMVFMEVDNTENWHKLVMAMDLAAKFSGSRVSSIRNEEWGKEFFVHDPAGVLWHFGEFIS